MAHATLTVELPSTSAIPKPGSVNGPNVACLVLLEYFCKFTVSTAWRKKKILEVQDGFKQWRDRTEADSSIPGSEGDVPIAAAAVDVALEQIDSALINHTFSSLLVHLVRLFYQVDPPAASLLAFKDNLAVVLIANAVAFLCEHHPAPATGSSASAQQYAHAQRRVAQSIAHTFVTDELVIAFAEILDTRNLEKIFSKILESEHRPPSSEGGDALSGWLTNSVNNHDLTVPPGAMHRRSFFGVQARRVRLRWIRLDFKERELAVNSVVGWCGTRTGMLSEKLKEIDARGQYGRGEIVLEDRVDAFDDYVKAVWCGDWSATRHNLSHFFDHAPQHAEHELHHHALINLSVFHMQSHNLATAESTIEEAVRLARHVNDVDAISLCAALLDRLQALKPISEPRILDRKLIVDTSSARFQPQRQIIPFSLETLWHARHAIDTGRCSLSEALNSLHELTWDFDPDFPASFLGGTLGFGGNKTPMARKLRKLKQRRRLRELQASAAQQGPTGGMTAASALAAAAREAQLRKLGRKEPRASLGKEAMRYDALRGSAWYDMGFADTAEALWDQALLELGMSGRSSQPCANEVRLDALGGKAFHLAEGGRYDEALALLLDPHLLCGLSLLEYHEWHKRIWRVLWLRARRSGHTATMKRLKEVRYEVELEVDGQNPADEGAPLDPFIGMDSKEPRGDRGPNEADFAARKHESAKERTLRLLREGKTAATLEEFSLALMPIMEAISLAHRFRLAPLQRAATVVLAELMATQMQMPKRARATISEVFAECIVDDNLERRADAKKAHAIILLANSAHTAEESKEVIRWLELADEDYAAVGADESRMACTSLLVHMHRHLHDETGCSRWLELHNEIEARLDAANNDSEVDPLVSRIERIAAQMGQRFNTAILSGAAQCMG